MEVDILHLKTVIYELWKCEGMHCWKGRDTVRALIYSHFHHQGNHSFFVCTSWRMAVSLCHEKGGAQGLQTMAIVLLLQIIGDCLLHSHSSMACLIPLQFQWVGVDSPLHFPFLLLKCLWWKEFQECLFDTVKNGRTPATVKTLLHTIHFTAPFVVNGLMVLPF